MSKPDTFEALVAEEAEDYYGAPESVLVAAWNLAIEAAAKVATEEESLYQMGHVHRVDGDVIAAAILKRKRPTTEEP